MSELTPKDIQGDILHRLPKNYENFLFFHINDPKQFRGAVPKLLELQPPATGEHVIEARRQLSTWDKSQGMMPLSFFNIGFSKDGLQALGINHSLLGDHHFSRGQLEEAQELGDPMVMKNGNLVPNWEVEFLELTQARKIHGIILVAGEENNVNNHGAEILKVLAGAASVVYQVEGNTLSPRGTEHFGWMDGISNPVVPGLTRDDPTVGQRVVEPGVLLLGAKGDPKQHDRPDWALGGSFMVFRKLKQYVPEFKQFLIETAIKQGADPSDPSGLKDAVRLLCARVFGRWKSGAPLQLTPFKDDPEFITSQ
ncbi:unnamed protein product [Rhizoctonia solani]|uniref:DyP dimeric alpha+beta barrel domain-containing protein n=1 Tax=Rhizoctonia solani TaxID=456999 RepID=A0A8H3CLL2_9AGAM|nr:unnamed protein product [Rhizoctonia solani]